MSFALICSGNVLHKFHLNLVWRCGFGTYQPDSAANAKDMGVYCDGSFTKCQCLNDIRRFSPHSRQFCKFLNRLRNVPAEFLNEHLAQINEIIRFTVGIGDRMNEVENFILCSFRHLRGIRECSKECRRNLVDSRIRTLGRKDYCNEHLEITLEVKLGISRGANAFQVIQRCGIKFFLRHDFCFMNNSLMILSKSAYFWTGIFRILRKCLPPSNLVLKKISNIWRTVSHSRNRAGNTRMLALLCLRVISAI